MRVGMQTVPLKYVKCAISALFFPHRMTQILMNALIGVQGGS